MFSDPVSFTGDTRVEVISVLANCGRDTDRARRALVTWIRRKQDKGRTTDHILTKLQDIETKFIKDISLHDAFRDARAETYLPRSQCLPLPAFIKSEPEVQPSEFVLATPYSSGLGLISSSSVELAALFSQGTSPPTPAWRLSRASHTSNASHGKPKTTQSHQSLPRIPVSHSPRIQIPWDRSLHSPVTSSSEDSELHYLAPSSAGQSSGPFTPLLTSHPVSPLSPITFCDQNLAPPRRLSHGLVSPRPITQMPIPRPYSQRSVPNTVLTSSSEGSDVRPGRYRSMSQPIRCMSPCRRKLTPPSSSPPVEPLPPIPAEDQVIDISPLSQQPPTPPQTSVVYPSPPRPHPIQPVPSPIPSVDESDPSDAYSLQQSWLGSVADLPSDVIVRQDSPIYVCHDELNAIGDMLESVVIECGGSPEVRQVVCKCIEFDHGYEPPYWQNQLQACGLNAEAAKHLVDEMCKQVNWGESCRRAIYV